MAPDGYGELVQLRGWVFESGIAKADLLIDLLEQLELTSLELFCQFAREGSGLSELVSQLFDMQTAMGGLQAKAYMARLQVSVRFDACRCSSPSRVRTCAAV